MSNVKVLIVEDHLMVRMGLSLVLEKIGDIDLSNGNIDIKDLKTKDGISFDTSRGNIRIERSNATGYDLDTSLGKITISGKKHGDSFEKNSDSRNVLEADTSLGSISVN